DVVNLLAIVLRLSPRLAQQFLLQLEPRRAEQPLDGEPRGDAQSVRCPAVRHLRRARQRRLTARSAAWLTARSAAWPGARLAAWLVGARRGPPPGSAQAQVEAAGGQSGTAPEPILID